MDIFLLGARAGLHYRRGEKGWVFLVDPFYIVGLNLKGMNAGGNSWVGGFE